MYTHPSTAGLDDLSSSDWARESSSLVSILPGVTGDGQLWLVDTCSLSSGSDSEEGGWESRADRSMNSSCHNLEERPERQCVKDRTFNTKCQRCDYLWDQRVGVVACRGCAVVQESIERQIRKKSVFQISCVGFKASDKISNSSVYYFKPATQA